MKTDHFVIHLQRKILIFLIGAVLFVTIQTKVFAASATIRFEIEKSEIELNEQVIVSLTIDSDSDLGDFEGNITYNSQILEYIEGPACVSGGDGMLHVEDMDASVSHHTRSYVMTFQAIGAGECEFGFAYAPLAFEYETNEAMSVSATSMVVRVEPPATASANANLSDLKIHPSSLTPSFDSAVTEYSVMVESSVEQLIISAIPQDINATVTVTGNENFQLGNNEVEIIVMAESGTTKVYKIHVQKMEGTLQPEPTQQVQQAALADNKVDVTSEDGVILLIGQYKYTVLNNIEGITIPEGYVKTNIKINGCTVPVYQLEKQIDDDYLLIALQNQYNQCGLYRYDRFEKTIQRYTGDRVLIQDSTQDIEYELTKQKKSYEKQLTEKNIIILIVSGIGIALLISVFTLALKGKGNHDDDF